MRSFSTRAVGLLILVHGVWGGLVPFIGPYFHFALGPNKSWTWTSGRLYLDVLPAAVAVVGGLMLISAGPRRSARLGALLALAAGIWFAIGPDVSQLWQAGGAQGIAHGSRTVRVLEMLAYHTGLGVLIAALAGYALPRFFPAEAVVAEPATATHGRGEPVADREAGGPAREPAADREAGGPAREPVADREAGAPAREPAAAATPVGERRDEATGGGPVAWEETAAGAPVAREETTGAGTVTRDEGAYEAAPTAQHRAVSEGDTAPVGDGRADGGGPAPAADPPDPAPSGPREAAQPSGQRGTGAYVRRRRRGGLLSPFLRR